jgi:SAM-dependent methyltransferase
MINYFDKNARDYLKKSESYIWSFLRLKEKTIIEKLLSPKSDSRLLDLGSGPGFYSLYFKNKYKIDVMAVDSSPAMIEELSSHGIKSICCSVEKFEIEEKFDLILAAGVFEFIDEPEIAFNRIFECLRPHGKFVLLVPSSGFWGLVYKLYHVLQGCPVKIRKIEVYQKMALAKGLTSSKVFYPTLISRVVCFSR